MLSYACLLNLSVFENKKYTASIWQNLDQEPEPMGTLEFTQRLPCHIIISIIICFQKQALNSAVPICAPMWREAL